MSLKNSLKRSLKTTAINFSGLGVGATLNTVIDCNSVFNGIPTVLTCEIDCNISYTYILMQSFSNISPNFFSPVSRNFLSTASPLGLLTGLNMTIGIFTISQRYINISISNVDIIPTVNSFIFLKAEIL